MSKTIYDQHFEKIDFTTLQAQSYDGCTFSSCQFSNVNLSHFEFSDCEFSECDLSLSKLGNTAWKDVRFYKCKLLGMPFKDSNPFLLQLHFQDCILDVSSFFQVPLKKTSFVDCSLKEVDFTEADLSRTDFSGSDLLMTVFDQSILVHADFRTAKNYSIDPDMNRISKTKFAIDNLAGLLEKHDIVIS